MKTKTRMDKVTITGLYSKNNNGNRAKEEGKQPYMRRDFLLRNPQLISLAEKIANN